MLHDLSIMGYDYLQTKKIFDTSDGRKNMSVAPGEKAAPRQKVRWAPRCQVWGAIGVGWRYLVVLDSDSSITSMSYIKTLPMELYFSARRGHGAHRARL